LPNLPWYVYAMLLAPLALVLFAATYKSLQVRAARDWPSTPGKVVISDSQVRDVRVLDDSREDGYRFEPRNFANIVYQYSVSGQTLTNNRVGLGEDRGNFGVAETIARYPVGTAVTVYYNSRHPRDAVLERDFPKGLWGCLGIGTVIVLAIVFGSAIGLHRLSEFVATRLVNPKTGPLVIGFGAFAFVVALFALALQRQASAAKRWPVVAGTIKMSGIEQYRAAPDRDSTRRGEVMYQRQVSYTYRFNDIAYTNVAASLATGFSSNSGWLVRKFTTAYQDGSTVKVYVNPANPSEAVLNPRARFAWVLWLFVLGFLVGAYFIAHGG
jgi:Protein of unknown function (DUF3592)